MKFSSRLQQIHSIWPSDTAAGILPALTGSEGASARRQSGSRSPTPWPTWPGSRPCRASPAARGRRNQTWQQERTAATTQQRVWSSAPPSNTIHTRHNLAWWERKVTFKQVGRLFGWRCSLVYADVGDYLHSGGQILMERRIGDTRTMRWQILLRYVHPYSLHTLCQSSGDWPAVCNGKNSADKHAYIHT